MRVTVNGRDVSRAFAVRADGKDEGLATGLRLGANSIVAALRDGRATELTVANHPLGGSAGVLRSADPALDLPGRSPRQAV